MLVMAGLLLAAGSAAYYFFVVFSSNERLREAQKQVIVWEARWLEARACVLGATPLAADFGDAMTAREIERGTTEAAMGDCTRAIGRLARPEGNESGLPRVETSWDHLEAAATKVALRYVAHRRTPLLDTSLLESVERLRDARATLRQQVELSIADAPMGPAIAELRVHPLLLDGQAVTDLTGSSDGTSVRGRLSVDGRWYTAKLEGGAAVTAVAVIDAQPTTPEVVRSLPDGTWGVSIVFDSKDARKMQLVTGRIEESGQLGAATVVVAAPSLMVDAALGTSAQRAVLYVDSRGMMAATSHDGGATWARTALSASREGSRFVFGDATADVVWEQAGDIDVVSWQRVRAAELPLLGKAVSLPAAALVQACAAAHAPWVLLERDDGLVLVRMDHLEPAIEVGDPAMSSFLGCDDDAVLLSDAQRQTLVVCEAGRCRPFRAGPDPGVGAVVAGVPMFVVSRNQVLAILSPGVPPRLFRLPAATTPYALFDINGVPYLLLQRTSGQLVGSLLR
jgi:hypothetical protein